MYSIAVIPGKNATLSLAEVGAFLKKKKHKFQIESFSKEFFILNLEKKIDPSIIDEFGGIIKIAEINTFFQTLLLKKAIINKNEESKDEIKKMFSEKTKILENLRSTEKKTVFGISVYCSDKKLKKFEKTIHRFFGSIIKKKISEKGKSSRFIGFSKTRKHPRLSHIEVLKKKLIESKSEQIININEKFTWLSTTKAVHNPFEFQKRDIEKPIQRKIFAMPPRLAKILINLSLCDKGSILLDPFCGIGSILQEGLLIGSKVIGVDINPWCIKASERNLAWLIKEYQIVKPNFRVIQGDVQNLTKKIGYEEIDCIATEPDLGPALRQIPTNSYAIKIIKKLDTLYSSFIKEAYKVLKKNGRCIFVTPFLRTRSGKIIKMNIDKKIEKVGFNRVFPLKINQFKNPNNINEELWNFRSIIDISKKHKTGREIHILQK
jgi:tRNA G10  N-methylase Trm11